MLRYDASRLRAFRVLATILGAAMALQSLQSLVDHDPDAPNALWSAVPLALALGAIALAWRRRPVAPLATLTLVAAAATQAFTLFGDSLLARIAAGAVLAVMAGIISWAYLALPLLAWRRGRWPADPVVFAPLTHGDDMPDDVRERIGALAAIGFAPRLVHARAEGGTSAFMVLLAHGRRDAFAMVSHFTVNGSTFANTRLMTPPGAHGRALSLVDALGPAPFPPAPDHELLLFPDADAATLLANFLRLHAADAPATPLDDDALQAAMATVWTAYDRWLLDAGYLAAAADDEVPRYTLKGGFTAVLRPLWPWAALERARRARNGRDALRGASGAGAS